MSQLFCVIPTCRIPGQHRDDCDQADCRGCLPRLATEGYACDSCVGYQHQLLGVIADLAPDARAVAAGQIRRGPSAGGGGKPGSRPPLDAGATDALDEITASLAKIARRIAHTRGLRGPLSHAEGRTLGLPLETVCSWLSDQAGWVRHALDDQGQPYAPTVHTAIRDAANRIRAIVNGPSARRYLGPCGATGTTTNPCCDSHNQHCEHGELCCNQCTEAAHTTFPIPHADGSRCVDTPCDGDVYFRTGAVYGICRTCGTQHPQDDRQVWINDITRDRAYRAAHIADAHRINVNTIRSWAHRGRLTTWWNDNGQLAEWTTPEPHDDQDLSHRGPRLYVLGDVLNLAAAEAARREQHRAEREQAQAEPAEMGA